MQKRKIDFIQFVNLVNPNYKWYPYAEKLAGLLQRVSNGELKRLMIFMPPRHGKSELVSRLFPAYYLYQHPNHQVGINSYAAELAYTFSRSARDNYTRIGNTLKGDAQAVKHWETEQGGILWASGVGGPITGKGFNLGIIDDPVKNAQEATSPVVQRRNNDWYDSTFSTREEPNAAVILIMTRWNLKDLANHIFDREEDEPERWHIVHFEAIKGDSLPDYPITCTIEPDTRESGEALAPSRYPLEKLKKICNRIGLYFWNALYQQNPVQREGRVYYTFGENCIGPHSLDLDYSRATGYWHSHDFGAVNRVWGLFVCIDDVYYQIHEEMLPEGTTATRASIINSHLEGRKVVTGFGGAKSEGQQRLDYQNEDIYIEEPVIDDVESQIDATNRMLENGKLKICSDMTLTINQLESCIRNEKDEIADKSIWHFLDMLRYLAIGVYESNEVYVSTVRIPA